MVAVSPEFGSGDMDRLLGDRARSSWEGARFTAVAGSYDDERIAIARRSRVVLAIRGWSKNHKLSRY